MIPPTTPMVTPTDPVGGSVGATVGTAVGGGVVGSTTAVVGVGVTPPPVAATVTVVVHNSLDLPLSSVNDTVALYEFPEEYV